MTAFRRISERTSVMSSTLWQPIAGSLSFQQLVIESFLCFPVTNLASATVLLTLLLIMTCRQCIGQSLAHMMHDIGVAVLLSQFSFQLAPKVQISLFALTDIPVSSVGSQIHFNVHAHFCISLLETRGLEIRAWP